MERKELIRCIAETGYNVGFGAKRHFATFDIVDKMPGFISFVAIAMGIFGLVWEALAGKLVAATLAVTGVMGVYILMYDARKSEYERVGVALTQILNRLRTLIETAKACSDADLPACEAELRSIQAEYPSLAISKQIMFSGMWAHYKFFWEQQAGWIDEQLHFRFFRDKVPPTLWLLQRKRVLMAALR